MIILELNKIREIKAGDVIHLRVTSVESEFSGGCKLKAEDITPLPGAEGPGYGCHLCGEIKEASEDGSLPEGWVEKKFSERSFFVCDECEEDPHPPYCRVCGCTQDDSCEGGCHWVEEDLCSACEGKEKN